jgi:ABC-type sulfate/molybdate transport systems ATPase subunit
VRARVGALEMDLSIDGEDAPLALIGPNGSGKTTLLRMIAGLHRPDTGSIEVAGSSVYDTSTDVDVPSEFRRVGYLPQGYGLFPHLSVIENVAFGLSTGLDRLDSQTRRHVAWAALQDLDCTHLAERFPARLSGGEQQRVALARALVVRPRLLLLDEPLAALDATARRSVRGFLARHLGTLGTPTLMTTHDVRDVRAIDAYVYVMERGRIVQRGDLEALRAAPATDFVAEFMGLDGGPHGGAGR